MRKSFLKQLAATATVTGMVFSSIPVQPAEAKIAVTKTEGITQEKIDAANDAYNDVQTKVEFLSMSDMEFGFADGGTDAAAVQKKVYEEENPLYKRIKDWAAAKNFTVEGIMAAGDVVGANESEYYDCLAGNKARVQGAYLAVEQVLTENFGDETVVMLANGNHDIADMMGETLETKHKKDGVWYFGDSSMEYVGNFHTKINGYDFITLDYNGKNTFGYGGQRTGYQEFLRRTLAEISSAEDYDSAKPIFVQAHSGYQGTTLGGQWAGVYDTMGMDLQTILSDYPQALMFSAHTHFPVEEEAAVYQKNFTFVENGSMNYIYKDVAGDFIEGGYLTTGNAEMPEKTCNFISVLENGKTVIRRFDVSNERWIGMPWVIDTTNGKDGFTYTDSKRSTVAPWFEEEAEIKASDVTKDRVTFTFDQAEDDELVNHYQVTIKDTFTGKPAVMNVKGLGAEKSVTGTFRALSRYYYRPNTMQFEISGLEEGKIYSAEIYAVDDFGNKSANALKGTFQTDGTLSFPDVEGGVILPENITEGKYFEMNFESNLKDEIGERTGSANGNVSYTESYRSDLGKAVKIGGSSNDYVDLGNREEWNLGTDKDLTINFWTKVNSCNGYGSILSNKNWTNWYRKGINIAPEGSDTSKLEFTLGDDTSAGGVYATGQVPQYQGAWHMMTFTVDRTNQTARTYMDGKLYAETSIADVKDMTSGLNMLLGVDGGKAYGAIGFDMDELEMWSRPLSEEDIRTYYNVTRDLSDLMAEALYYAEYRLNQIMENAENRYYDEVLTQNLKDTMEAAKETASMDNFLALKEAVKAVEEQPVRYLHIVDVVNGTGDGKFLYNTEVTVTADAPAAGMKFAGWKTVAQDGTESEIISTETQYTFYVSNSIILKAVYVEEEAVVEEKAQVLMTNVLTTKREDGKYDVKFVGQIVVPKGYTLKEAGLVWSSKDSTELVIGKGLKPTTIRKIGDTNQFSVTIKGMPEGRFLRGKLFAKLADDKGVVQDYIYSAEQVADPDNIFR